MTSERPPREGQPDPRDTDPRDDAEPVMASIRERRGRERRIWRTALAASVLVHALVFLLGPRGSVPLSPFAAAGPRSGDEVAADGVLEAVALRSAPPEIARPLPVPVVEVALPEPETIEPDADPEIDLEAPDLPE